MTTQTSRSEAVSTPMAAVLDACVLFPAALRDTLLRAAAKRLYRLHLTEDILAEVRRNLLGKKRIVDPGLADRLVDIGRFLNPLAATCQGGHTRDSE